MGAKLYGDWAKAGVMFKKFTVLLQPFIQAKLYEDGELVLNKIKGHVYSQDLAWTPLKDATVKKKGDDTIYIETGSLIDGLTVRKIKSTKNNIVLFVGASPWKKHPESGLKMSDLLIYLEYGTGNIPPRPLIEPSYMEVRKIIMNEWKGLLKDFVGGA